MRPSRRDLLKGSAALAAFASLPNKADAWLHPGASGNTPFADQGALSGGGYNKFLSMSNDGATLLVNYDGANGWIWDSVNTKWINVLSQTRVPGTALNAAFRDWGRVGASAAGNANAPTTYALQVAPSDATRLYCVVVAGAQYNTPGFIWKSTDGGASWTNTGFAVAAELVTSIFGSHSWGPTLAIDPVNPDIVLVGGIAGDIWMTTDGFATTFTCLSLLAGPLNGALPTAAITNISTSGGIPTYTFASTPTIVQNKNYPANGISASLATNYSVAFWNLKTPSGIITSGSTAENKVNTFTATTITSFGPPFQTTIIGDTLLFGWGPCIVFDPSSSSGGSTKTIYISWGYGANNVWVSTNGGTTFAATTGGPSKVAAMAVSTSGVLFAVENFTSTTGCWSFSAGAWTNIAALTQTPSNAFSTVACDPTNALRLIFGQGSGDIKISNDGGTTWFAPSAKLPRVATDVPWMSNYGTLENSMSAGYFLFDHVTSGKLWFAEGIGIWTATCPANSSTDIQWTSVTKGSPTIIVDQIIKPPGGKPVMTNQDRSGFVITNPLLEPQPTDAMRAAWLTIVDGYIDNGLGPGYNGTTGNVLTVTALDYSGANIVNTVCYKDTNQTLSAGVVNSLISGNAHAETVPSTFALTQSSSVSPQKFYCQFNAPINHGWGVAYAISNPSFLVMNVATYLFTSTDGGQTWIRLNVQPGGGQIAGGLACQTPSNFVWFPEGGLNPVYTLDGGATWANCLFAGSALAVGWEISVYDNRHVVCADEVNSTTYYAYNFSGVHSGIWVSTDSGANWTLLAGTASVLGNNSSGDFQLKAVKGFAGHLMSSPGTSFISAPPKWSVDGGNTWNAINNIQTGWQMVPGKGKSGNPYVSVFLAGILTAAADPTQTPGIFRSDDFDPNNPSTMTPTWIRYCNAPGLNMDVPKSMCGDWDTHGSFWGGFGGTGYFYGKLV